MTVDETMLGRMKKLLRVKFEIATGKVTAKSALGESPIGFDESFIKSEFRKRVSDWFADLIDPFPTVQWDEGTTIGDVIDDVLDRSTVKDIKKEAGYRTHAETLAETEFDEAAGRGAQTVPVAQRQTVQASMNEALESSLMRNVSLDDLAGDRETILANVVDRMLL